MGYNSRELKASPDAKAPAKPKDVIYDPEGQWKFPGQVTRIPSGDITMQGVNYPVIGIDNNGVQQFMLPNMNYNFPNAQYVTEYPQMKRGGISVDKAKAFLEDGSIYGHPLSSAQQEYFQSLLEDSGMFDDTSVEDAPEDNPLEEPLDELRRGGVNPLMRSRSKRASTNKNIQSSINKLFLRNYDLFGPGGKNIYEPSSNNKTMSTKKKLGGTPEAFPQQPTQAEFFNFGPYPSGPVGFYAQGGPLNTNEIAFPQQPTANRFYNGNGPIKGGPQAFYDCGGPFPQQPTADVFFSGAPWTPHYPDGGGVPVTPVYGQSFVHNLGPGELPFTQAQLDQYGLVQWTQEQDSSTFDTKGSYKVNPYIPPAKPVKKPIYPTRTDYSAGSRGPAFTMQEVGGEIECPECEEQFGGMVDDAMELYKSGGANWIQKATKNMRTDKPCTGSKFGSKSCPPGSKRYNLAKTFRAMAKKQEGGASDDGVSEDQYGKKLTNTFMNAINNNTMMSIADDAAEQVRGQFEYPMAQMGMTMQDYGYNPNMNNNQLYQDKFNMMDNQRKMANQNFIGATQNVVGQYNPHMEYEMPMAQNGRAIAPNNQATYRTNGFNYLPANYYSGFAWQGQDGQAADWSKLMQNADQTYLRDMNEKKTYGAMDRFLTGFRKDKNKHFFGPKTVERSMTFRTYFDPVTGEQKQVPATQPQYPSSYKPNATQSGYIYNQPYTEEEYLQRNPNERPRTGILNQQSQAPDVDKAEWLRRNIMKARNPAPAPQGMYPSVDPNWQPQGYNPFQSGGAMNMNTDPNAFLYSNDPFGMNAPAPQAPVVQQFQMNPEPGPMTSAGYYDTTVTQKGKRSSGIDGETAANWMLAGTQGLTSMFEAKERRALDEKMKKNTLADNVFSSVPANSIQNQGRWNWTGMSNGMMDPNNMEVVQQRGYQVGGGVVEMDENEIAEFLRQGGQIQYVD